jgi:L-alanine-DL-glutamate epimerase-like enolase superfamily enzyme
MKITQVKTQLFPDPLIPQVLVEVTTDEGLKGVGEAWWGLPLGPVESAIREVLGPQVLGHDPRQIQFLWEKMYRYAYRYGTEGVILCAMSGVDLALWDLLGKRHGVPVAHLMGGLVRNSIRAYASLPPLRDEGRLRTEIQRAVDAGFKGVKLHEVEVRMAAVAREVLPEGFALMVDVNGQFSPVEAEDVARRLRDFQVTWFEEPVWPMQDHEAMRRVRDRSGILLAAGENEYQFRGFHRLMSSGAVDYVMAEIAKVGGLTMVLKISALAELLNFPICPHGYRIGPALYANVQWALSHTEVDWLEIPWLPEGYLFPAAVPMPAIENGRIRLPPGPGLGVPLE